jgi:hypothetical protein
MSLASASTVLHVPVARFGYFGSGVNLLIWPVSLNRDQST